jgi:hypothetical protein
MSQAAIRRRPLERLAALSDGAILRVAFYAMLAGTLTVLWFDYSELTAAGDGLGTTLEPILPGFSPDGPARGPGPVVTSDVEALRAPLSITLEGGVLSLTGTIDAGSATRFAAEVEARGEYVMKVAFDSPGGSVGDAIAIGELIRSRGFGTLVEAGRLCASSCPLAFAGGVERQAAEGAAIGVHQIYAAVNGAELPSGLRAAGEAISNAQKTTAAISRHLSDMEVDPAIWLHALETPPDRLYYFSPAEMAAYNLVTPAQPGPSEARRRSS